MARRRLSGRVRYTRLDWFTNDDMWDPTEFRLPQNSSVAMWNIGPDEEEKSWTVKRIMGTIRVVSEFQGTATFYWWIVKGIIDGSDTFVTRMENPADSQDAEDSFLTWRNFLVPPNDFSPTSTDVPYWNVCDLKVQRRLTYPEQLALMVFSNASSETIAVTNFFRVLIARP